MSGAEQSPADFAKGVPRQLDIHIGRKRNEMSASHHVLRLISDGLKTWLWSQNYIAFWNFSSRTSYHRPTFLCSSSLNLTKYPETIKQKIIKGFWKLEMEKVDLPETAGAWGMTTCRVPSVFLLCLMRPELGTGEVYSPEPLAGRENKNKKGMPSLFGKRPRKGQPTRDLVEHVKPCSLTGGSGGATRFQNQGPNGWSDLLAAARKSPDHPASAP